MISTVNLLALKVALGVGLPTAVAVSAIQWYVTDEHEAQFAGLALALALGLLVAFVVARMLVRPIASLSMAAQRIAAGDLSQPVHTDGWDAIGALARAVAGMRHALVDRERELLASRNDLEYRLLEQACLAEVAATEVQRRDDLLGALYKAAQSLAVESVLLLKQPLHVRILWSGTGIESGGFVASPSPLQSSHALRTGGELVLELHSVCSHDLPTRCAADEPGLTALARVLGDRLAGVIDEHG